MNERILVVDDEDTICRLLDSVLSHQGYQVTSVRDGSEALEELRYSDFDLILTDLKMPGVDGLELLRQSRTLFPETEVIILTGHATVETAVQAMKEGAYTYLTKPFNLDELTVTVSNCLKARQLRLEKERLSELVSLLELGRTLTSNLDSRSLYDQILTQVTQTFAPDHASLMLLDPTGERLILMVQWGLSDKVQVRDSYPVMNSIAGQVIQMQKPVLLLKDRLAADFVPYAHRPEIGSAMCVPLSYRERTLGVLNVARQVGQTTYEHDDLQLLSVFAVQATIAIQNAQLYRDLQTLERASSQLTTTLDRQQIVRTALVVARDVMKPDVVALCLWDGNDSQPAAYALAVNSLSESALDSLRVRLADRFKLFVAHSPELTHLHLEFPKVNPVSLEFLVSVEGTQAPPASTTLASFISAPLLHGETVFGLLTCASMTEEAFDENSVRLLSTLGNTVSIALRNAAAYQNLKEFNFQVIASLTTALEARDPYTRGHSEQVSRFAVAIAREMGLVEHEVEQLRIAGLLHDIGKVRVSDLILNKTGRLTDEEWVCMKEHPVVGAQIVAGVSSLRGIASIIRHHHEYYDGSGYPNGLAGRDIPFLARILTVADGFEAMTSNRAYREARTVSEALEILKARRNRQWDAHVVDTWHRVVQENPQLLDFESTTTSVL
jgi:putative nucleotidyltransferase with HDIG domain